MISHETYPAQDKFPDEAGFDLSETESFDMLDDSSEELDFRQMNNLVADEVSYATGYGAVSKQNYDIRHAPLVSGDIVRGADEHLLPQIGFLGNQGTGQMDELRSKVFSNTNIPFSTFICGVQGSGKSHTTACFLGMSF